MDEIDLNQLDRIIELLEELVKWQRLIAFDQVRSRLESVLDTDKKKAIYELSDGQTTIKEICNAVGVKSTAIIHGYWTEWEAMGIVEQAKRKGRRKRMFSLMDFGIEVPEIARR
jgi:predicted ArsR family transcriptional regulator